MNFYLKYFTVTAVFAMIIKPTRSSGNHNSILSQLASNFPEKEPQPQRGFDKLQNFVAPQSLNPPDKRHGHQRVVNKSLGMRPKFPAEKSKQKDPECTSDELTLERRQNLTNPPNSLLDFRLVEDGMFWSKDVENILPEGLTDNDFRDWRSTIEKRELVYIEHGTLTKCGRDGNAHAILSDGTQLCIRNSRHGTLGLLGEMLAFQLSRFMQIRTLPAIAIKKITTNESSTWAGQRSRLEELELVDGIYVALIQWIPNLTEAHFPSLIQEDPRNVMAGNPLLLTLDNQSLVYLAQWTDLVVFDYITGHIDRMTIVLDAVRKTGKKWLMKTSIHNLGRSSVTGSLCIFDNECAFFASYPLYLNQKMGQTLTEMYDELLTSVCIFRRSTVEAVRKLSQMDDVSGYLLARLRETDAEAKEMLSEVYGDRIEIHKEINHRIENVYKHMQTCLHTEIG